MRFRSVLAAPLALLLCATAAPAATETYLFRGSFAPEEGAGNVLVPVSNATSAIVTDGPDFKNGAFVPQTISASACAETPEVQAWSFPTEAGLRYPNASPALVTGTYSVSMLLRYDPMDDGYARLIDFSNSTLDTGIYKYDDGVRFYPISGTLASGSFVQGQDVFVTITRDGGTKEAKLYINGALSDTVNDTTNLYAPSASIVYLLMDNTTGSAAISETDAGVISYLQIRDTVMSADDVAASLADICEAVSAPTTTTTTLPGACGTPAATYDSILCRLDALKDRVQTESGLGTYREKLGKLVQKARALTVDAQGATGKKAKKKLQQAAKQLNTYGHKLSSLSARKKLEAALRNEFIQAGKAIENDLKALRGQL